LKNLLRYRDLDKLKVEADNSKTKRYKNDGRELKQVVKGIDMVRRHREKIIKYYVKNQKYGFVDSKVEKIARKASYSKVERPKQPESRTRQQAKEYKKLSDEI
jgi:hypothetical protein